MSGIRGFGDDARAWAEIDLDALDHNATHLRAQLHKGCQLMAVVKANAYGHGSVKVAQRLSASGIDAFVVATVDEGVQLRESGLGGEILVVGYTHPSQAGILNEYRLAQLIVDGAYAAALDKSGYKLHVHIAVDTGMHRLGIRPDNTAEIESVFMCRNLIVDGISSDMAASDSLDADDVAYTQMQTDKFFRVVDAIKSIGHSTGKLHFQSSYGIYNYPGITCDYARIGIALYGVMSHDANMRIKPQLKPVLSLRARIAEIKSINKGDSVSYGRGFTASKQMKIATVCIGYADGVPRQLTGNGGVCIIDGKKVPIIGRICMDMLMVDVTEIDSIAQGSIATIIGKDGREIIRCEDVAKGCGTISNDILSRLGGRLPRIYVEAD